MDTNLPDNISINTGSIFNSTAHTITVPVNCQGVMGKGLALAFKQRFPTMYLNYVERCRQERVILGEPYIYRMLDRNILVFPTKDHWRDESRLVDIVAGMERLVVACKIETTAIMLRSLALPALGCGLGKLLWEDVGPILTRYGARLPISVYIYPPEADPW